jgi:hypothetical protein
VRKEGISFDLIDTHGTAEHDQKIGLLDRRVSQVIGRCLAIGGVPAGLLQNGCQHAQILERDMAKDNG